MKMNEPHPIRLQSCPKAWTKDLDKAATPADTIKSVMARLEKTGLDIVSEVKRVDVGRLGIPVYLGVCGTDARAVMPTRKQMGKGSSLDQARASALMELMERFAFFSFRESGQGMVRCRWHDAERLFGPDLIPVEQMLRSVNDRLANETARDLLDLVEWNFYPSTRIRDGKIVWLPLDWFWMLGEFNGSSAGNTAEESLLQGISELIERHACCLVDQNHPVLPRIRLRDDDDPVVIDLCGAFEKRGIQLILKDASQGMPLPTIAAIAWDPATFPEKSEIVFTAGTASSPAKAAIRAITEVAQLGGDFITNSCYEASGLPKFTSLEECDWLMNGPEKSLLDLPNLEDRDIFQELTRVLDALLPIEVYAVETTHPLIGVPAHYCMAPGLQFRERDRNQSLGLFIGRKIAETAEFEEAARGLDILAKAVPNAHYLPFFQGLLTLRRGDPAHASQLFLEAAPLQPDDDTKALAYFYGGYALTQRQDWEPAIIHLQKALGLCPQMKEYANLLGVALFKVGNWPEAEECFSAALKIDKGSAMDLANRGLCRKFQGKNADAEKDLRAALELDPGIEFARRHLAELEDIHM